MKTCGSGLFACQQTNGIFPDARNFCTSDVFFRESVDTRATATSFEENPLAAETRAGISSRHGSHHVAQKFTRRTRPFFAATTRARYCSGFTSFTLSEAAGRAKATRTAAGNRILRESLKRA